MSQETLNLFFALAVVAAFVLAGAGYFVMHRNVKGLLDVIKAGNENPVFISNAKAAAESVPQEVFLKALALDGMVKQLAQSDDLKALADQVAILIKKIDHDPMNDTQVVDGVSAATSPYMMKLLGTNGITKTYGVITGHGSPIGVTNSPSVVGTPQVDAPPEP